jgi:hypothetical protein
MPVQRKQQILIARESSEGVSANPGGANAVQIFDPSPPVDNVEVLDRVPAGATLSRDVTPIGRKTRTEAFKSDFRGSADITIPITAPEWALLLEACGYKVSTIQKLTMGAVTGTGFQAGEIVSQSAGAVRGVVVGGFTVGGVITDRMASNGGHIAVVPIVGTFTAAATTGESSASTSTASAAAAYEGYGLQPTSDKLINVLTAAWAGGTPAAAGETLAVEDAGTNVRIGAVQVVTDNSAGAFTNIDVVLLWGSIANTNRLRNAAGTGTGVINAVPTQIRTPSLTIRHNLDGRRRDLLGARCDFTLEAEVGQPAQFSWTASGDIGTDLDALPAVTSGLSTVRPPRFFGALRGYGVGSELHGIPTKRFSLAGGGTVNPNLDGGRAGGATGSNVTDKDPALTVTVDAVNGALPWESIRDAGTLVRAVFILGTVKGNICSLVIPAGQVTEVTHGDADGIATHEVTIRPRRILEGGDDDLFLVQL